MAALLNWQQMRPHAKSQNPLQLCSAHGDFPVDWADRRRRRSAAAVVPPRKPGWLLEPVPCKIGAPVTGFVLAQGTHQTGFEIAEYHRLCIVLGISGGC